MAALALAPSVKPLYDRFLIVIAHSHLSSPTALMAAGTACSTASFQSSPTSDPPPGLLSLNWTVGHSCRSSLSIWRTMEW